MLVVLIVLGFAMWLGAPAMDDALKSQGQGRVVVAVSSAGAPASATRRELVAQATVTAETGVHPSLDPAKFPRKTFVPVPCEKTIDLTPWPCAGGSKHQRWASDGKGSVWTGFGDTNPTRHASNPSQNQGYRLEVATGRWTRWNPACRPAGQIMPSYPDEVPWAYDARGAFWLLPGVLQVADGATCASKGESGATLYKTGLFRYDIATDRWQRIEGAPSTNALWGHFDNRTRNLMYWGTGGCASRFFKLNVDTLEHTHRDVCLSTRPFPGSGGNFENYADGRAHAWAWDENGRTAYFVAHHDVFEKGQRAGRRIHAWSLNVDSGKIEQLPDPPNTTPKGGVTPDAQDILWDSANKRVLYPYVRNHCGVLEGMYTYDPARGAWESHSVTPSSPVPGGSVRGNTAVYDPANNVMVLGGTVACDEWGYSGQPNLTHYFLWRG
jgi:hypothetical protein